MYSGIAFYSTSIFEPDLERYEYLCKTKFFRFQTVSLFSAFRYVRRYDTVLVTDSLSGFELLLVLLVTNLVGRKKIEVLILELYSLSFNAIKSDFGNSKRSNSYVVSIIYNIYLFVLRTLKFVIIDRFCVRSSKVYITSNARRDFLAHMVKEKLRVLPNLPMSNFANGLPCEIDLTIKGNFFYLPGRINNFDDLIKLLRVLKASDIKLVVSSSEKVPDSILSDYDEWILETGILSHACVKNLMNRCIGGVVLYNDVSVNQKYASSSKLFEFVFLGKTVIVSNNYGVLEDLKFFKIDNYIVIDSIEDYSFVDFLKKHSPRSSESGQLSFEAYIAYTDLL